MGSEIRCERCLKGINQRDKLVVIEEAAYHFKCAERLEKGRR